MICCCCWQIVCSVLITCSRTRTRTRERERARTHLDSSNKGCASRRDDCKHNVRLSKGQHWLRFEAALHRSRGNTWPRHWRLYSGPTPARETQPNPSPSSNSNVNLNFNSNSIQVPRRHTQNKIRKSHFIATGEGWLIDGATLRTHCHPRNRVDGTAIVLTTVNAPM